ncbi:efflux RND transporter periplasmic adaptor subunit [Oceanicella actignis]|uniref:HlyD family secretion protein n=1 Tax=Oceanicella actignis TaxID=1189325 RepID=A0A1M7T437_9RHOB|nr:HlyD family efflux transporter periplasmic adaptor subunit [Oceanicella actignis]SET40785.1 HlyD family secretion protein [Oceanicella actignis]SHN65414.1 HlyD family secretion protein [Oceanicella actignis]
MRFVMRAAIGAALTAATLALLALAALRVGDALEARREGGARPQAAAERARVAAVLTLTPTRVRPVIRAHGRVRSGRTLELRASAAGTLAQLSPNFADGGHVAAGELVFALDPAPLQSALERARIARDEANAALAEAEDEVALAEAELASARAQADLRAAALERQRSLRERGVGSDASVEAAQLALAAARQAALGRQQALAAARARVTRAGIALARARLQVADAERELREARVAAPFDGILANAAAAQGRRVAAGERLAELIDLSALEAAFEVSSDEFARLLGPDGRLIDAPVRVLLEMDGLPLSAPAVLARAGAEVAAGGAGRMVYARLDPSAGAFLRPGDFVAVEVTEPELADVAVIPAAAADAAGRILIVNAQGRLEERAVRILRRQGDSLIVADAPFGARYAAARLPQLAPGVRVRPVSADAATGSGAGAGPGAEPGADTRAGKGAGGGAGGGAETGDDTVTLDPARRARLIARVRAAPLPEDERARLLAALSAARAPRALVERLESPEGG